MTLREAIDRADAQKPNSIEYGQKARWLSELDGSVYDEVIYTHEGSEAYYAPTEYIEGQDDTVPLLIEHPYDGVYVEWLKMNIALAEGEIDRYNVGLSMYDSAMSAWRKYWNRTHMPKKGC